MPILVKEHTWSQTSRTVSLAVPLRGANASKVDIFQTSRYVKV